MDYKEAVKNIRDEMEKYFVKNKMRSVILGISGGVDSALVAALVAPVCLKLKIPLIGRWLHIESNKQDEMDRADAVGDCFCQDYKNLDLTEAYYGLLSGIVGPHPNADNHADKIRQGNIKARIRMIQLYDLAGSNKGLVLSTDNYTEMCLGFFSIHGDHNDYGPIQMLWKNEVYAMTQYLIAFDKLSDKRVKALQDCCEATPTDGLGITDSDLEQLGAESYDAVDEILKDWLNGITKDTKNPVIKRHVNSQFKRDWPITIPRDVITPGFDIMGKAVGDSGNVKVTVDVS